jgi:glucose-1-phosphate cytidylyltransferase
VLTKKIFDYLDDSGDCDFEYGPLEKIAKNGELNAYRHSGFWACMDTLRDTEKLNNLWNSNKAEWKIW